MLSRMSRASFGIGSIEKGSRFFAGEERQVEEVVDGGDDDEHRADAVPIAAPSAPPNTFMNEARVDGRLRRRRAAAERPAGDAEQDHAESMSQCWARWWMSNRITLRRRVRVRAVPGFFESRLRSS